jgi:hypothetical protein
MLAQQIELLKVEGQLTVSFEGMNFVPTLSYRNSSGIRLWL